MVHSVVVHSIRIYKNSSLKLDNDLGVQTSYLDWFELVCYYWPFNWI